MSSECEVNYVCSCGKSMPLIYLFVCKYCVTLRCPRCLSHEVDSYYCPHCLENIPSTDAKSTKNRCLSCLECPNCTNFLQVRSAQVPTVRRDGGGKLKGFGSFKKVYYQQCSFCFWTTRDINQPDRESTSGPWVDTPPEDAWMSSVINYWRHLMQKEKVEMEKRKRQRRGSLLGSLGISDKLLPFSKLRGTFSMNLAGSGQFDENIVKSFVKVEASEETEPADESFYTAPGEAYDYATIPSRINQPCDSVYKSTDLKARCTHLMVKRSQRCRECEHNLSKPEFNPASIKFKIHQIALRFVPRFHIVKKVEISDDSFTKVQLSLTNPAEHNLPVQLVPIPEGHPVLKTLTGEVVLPGKEIMLAARDDTTQFDPENQSTEFNDDPEVVVSRRLNKVTFTVKVKRVEGSEGPVRIGFVLRYKYKNLTPSIRPEEPKEAEEVLVEPVLTIVL